MSIFLAARWSNLILATYRVPDAMVRGLVHPALDLDRWDGDAHVSLVAFDFRDTRVLLCRVPGYIAFPEVNLRTYVRHGGVRGVAFIRELVPQKLVAAVARTVYNEPYRAARMESATAIGGDRVCVTHRVFTGGREHTVTAVGSNEAVVPPPGGVEHFFKEHEWGFGRTRDGRLLRFRVRHPVWAVRTLHDIVLDVDFGAMYGSEWAWLTGTAPVSVIFAVGSPVVVDAPRVIAAR